MPWTERRDVCVHKRRHRHTRPLTTAAAPGDWNWRARNNSSPELNAEIEFPFLKRHEGFSLLFQRWILPEVRGWRGKSKPRRVRKHQLSAPHVGSEGRRDKCCVTPCVSVTLGEARSMKSHMDLSHKNNVLMRRSFLNWWMEGKIWGQTFYFS